MNTRGFTLIELSIVLVIIGLIVGGVLVGQDLIKAAEMRSITSDLTKLETAVNAFKLKYNCLPGDCASASSFGLGSNGNGNKYIEYWSAPAAAAWRKEHFRFFSHMASAQMIEGSYTGTGGSGHADHDVDVGINIPSTKRSGVGIHLVRFVVQNNDYGANAINKHLLFVGKDIGTPLGWSTMGGAFSIVEVRQLDDKIDDGIANSGFLRTRLELATLNTTGCTTGVAPSYSYGTSTTALCNIIYDLKF